MAFRSKNANPKLTARRTSNPFSYVKKRLCKTRHLRGTSGDSLFLTELCFQTQESRQPFLRMRQEKATSLSPFGVFLPGRSFRVAHLKHRQGFISGSNCTMDISDAINHRKSIRAFKPDPVPLEILKKILEQSTRAPSWANTQPWEFAVATGQPLNEIREGFLEKSSTSPSPDVPRPPEFPERYAARIRVLDKQNRLVTPKDWDSRRVQFQALWCAGGYLSSYRSRILLPDQRSKRVGSV